MLKSDEHNFFISSRANVETDSTRWRTKHEWLTTLKKFQNGCVEEKSKQPSSRCVEPRSERERRWEGEKEIGEKKSANWTWT